MHCAEIIDIEGASYRLEEAKERSAAKAAARSKRRAPSAEERGVMQRALASVADQKFPDGWFFDDHMRQIPDHYHLHARPYPSWLPKKLRRCCGLPAVRQRWGWRRPAA